MDFGRILRRSWELTIGHRWLWWLGILAAFTEGTTGSIARFPTTVPGSAPTGAGPDPLTHLIQTWTTTDTQIAIGLGVVLLLVVLVFAYLSFAADAGLIQSVDQLEVDGTSLGFGPAFHRGRAFVWRLFGLNLLMGVLALTPLGLLAGILVGLYGALSHGTPLAIGLVLLGLIGLLVWLVFVFYLSIVQRLAQRGIVLHGQRIVAAVRGAMTLVRDQVGSAAVTLLVLVGVGLLVGLGLIVALFVVLAVLIALGALIYLATKTVGTIIYGGIALLALTAALIVWSGIYTTFLSSYWTLSYRALAYLHQQPASRRVAQ